MDAYVINLKRRIDRWTAIQAAFKDTGVMLHRVDAVEHPNGSYGCSMSHLKIVQMAKDKGLSSVLILEDDCLPGDKFADRWSRIKKWLDTHPDEWEIFNGGGSVVGDCKLYKCPESDICFFKTSTMWHAHFIYIPQRMYDKVLEYPDKDTGNITVLIDAWLNQHFNTLSTYPFLGKTQNGFSNIEKRNRINISGTFSASEKKYKNAMNASKKGGRRTRTYRKKKRTRKI